ncbi:HK97 family phage prohead protease [Nakamurella sp.]|uniref:HK97 family phage prohead protease n=1 Tax=Nakamurella sp. TaxID=1869182 RepID=UPI003B3AEE77
MKVKTFPGRVKAAGEPGTDEGVFEAIVSVFGNVDSVGDVVMPGAFTDTLAEWAAKGDPIPVLWSHMSHDPDYHIGEVIEAKEVDEGLWVKARIDLDEPKSRKVFKLLKGRRVTQFSFAYDIDEGGWGKRGDEEIYELRKLKLYEVGPTLIGANQDTELLAVKAGQQCPTCGQTDSTKAKPAPAADDTTPTPATEPAPAPSVEPTLSPASVLLSLQVDALAYDLD